MHTALVIGASRGIGLELVRQYLAEGWRVIATARDEAGLALLKSLGAQALRVDVANPMSVSVQGAPVRMANFVKASQAATPELISPPPPYNTGFLARASKLAA